MKRFLLIMVCAMLGGCLTAGKRGADTPVTTYDFGPPAKRLLADQRPYPIALEVRAPLWFDTLGIDYRLAYQDVSRLREYARARWVGPPAQLIQQRLLQQLDYVVAGQSQARCLLRIEISEFSQIFESTQQSHAILQGKVSLLDRARRPVGERGVDIHLAAVTPDAQGGVAAMAATVSQLASELAAWEKNLAATPAGTACFR